MGAPSGNRRVGLVGWRGMVGSVLLHRMRECGDLDRDDVDYFLLSTSQGGRPSPIREIGADVLDAGDTGALGGMDCLLSCQGSGYTRDIHPRLRGLGWNGLWIDAASHLRTAPASCLVLDPVNEPMINERLDGNCRDFIGANCTVSLMMMAIWPLLRDRLVESVFASTYQSASGAGAAGIEQLIGQMGELGEAPAGPDDEAGSCEHPVLRRARAAESRLLGRHSEAAAFAAPLAGNVIPWIDSQIADTGQSREEWKAEVECNSILGSPDDDRVAIEGVCVRVPVLRCHSQSLLLRLRSPMDAADASRRLAGNEWVDVIDNNPEATAAGLHPLAASSRLRIKVGRIRRAFGARGDERSLQLFTVGDQLLWGAAEPLRRMLALWLGRR